MLVGEYPEDRNCIFGSLIPQSLADQIPVTGTDVGFKLINLSFASRGSNPLTLAAWRVTENSAYPMYKKPYHQPQDSGQLKKPEYNQSEISDGKWHGIFGSHPMLIQMDRHGL